MLLSIGLENGIEGRSLAWALDFPGCFAYGADGKTALMAVPQAFIKYSDWVAGHDPDSWLAGLKDFDVRLEESWQVYAINRQYQPVESGGHEVGAWFRRDWIPLTAQDIQRGQALLAWSRADLLAAVEGVSPKILEAAYPGERWSIGGILSHVATAEFWYLDRLGQTGALERAALPKDPFQRLAITRRRLEEVLPALEGKEQVVGKDGEFWSPRKLLRRSVWHELDHIGHIYRLLAS